MTTHTKHLGNFCATKEISYPLFALTSEFLLLCILFSKLAEDRCAMCMPLCTG